MSKLSDFVEYKKGFAFKSDDYSTQGYFVIRVSDFSDSSIDLSNAYRISESKVNATKHTELSENDVLIATVGSWASNPASVVGKVVRVPKLANRAFLNQNTVRLRTKVPEEQLFLYYLLKNKDFSEYIVSTAQGSANQASITLNSILNYEFIDLDLEAKKRIIYYLDIFDQKIQLNTQINQTLEQIAQAVFKSWFIDFDPVRAKAAAKAQGATDDQADQAAMSVISGKSLAELTTYRQTHPSDYQKLAQLAHHFPSEFDVIDGVEVPKGWGRVSLSELFVFIGGSQPPKSEHIYEEREGYERFIQNRDYANDNHKTYIPISKRNKRCEKKDILMDKYGEAGKVRFGISGAYNVALAKLEPKNNNTREFLRWYFMQEKVRDFLASASVASTRNSLNSTTFNGMMVVFPCDEILNAFENMIDKYIDMSLQVKQENNNLEQLRDLLLPKLLSGDI